MTLRSSSSRERLQPLAVRGHEVHPAQHLEGVVHAGEIGRPLLHCAEDVAEAADAVGEHGGDVAVDRRAAEIGRDGGGELAEVGAGEPGGDALDVARGERVAPVEAIWARSRRWASATERPIAPITPKGLRTRGLVDAGHEAGRGAEADDAAEARGRAQAAAVVGAGGERHLSQRQGHGRAARGAGAGLRRVEGIAGWAVDAVGGVGTGAELGRVGLAQDHGARLAQVGDAVLVGGGHVVLVEQRAEGGPEPRGRLQVLDADRQACEQAHLLAAADGLSRSPGRACALRPRPWPRWR